MPLYVFQIECQMVLNVFICIPGTHTDSVSESSCGDVPKAVNLTSSYELLSPGFTTNSYGDRRNCSTQVTSPESTQVSNRTVGRIVELQIQ